MSSSVLETDAKPGIPLPSLRRLPGYYRRLMQAMDEGVLAISSEELGRSIGVPGAHVRKDLGYVLSQSGRPGVGYDVQWLAAQLQEFLGLVNDKEAVLVARATSGGPGDVSGVHPLRPPDRRPVRHRSGQGGPEYRRASGAPRR